MKFTLPFLFSIFLIGCSTSEPVEKESVSATDSILIKSQNNLDTAAFVNHKSDSITKQNVVKVIREIKFLTNEVEKYREINLMMSQKVVNEKVIYKIDTVYIETKRNFWGKEKTSTSIKSDSMVNETTDTSINNSIKIDTTSQIVNN